MVQDTQENFWTALNQFYVPRFGGLVRNYTCQEPNSFLCSSLPVPHSCWQTVADCNNYLLFSWFTQTTKYFHNENFRIYCNTQCQLVWAINPWLHVLFIIQPILYIHIAASCSGGQSRHSVYETTHTQIVAKSQILVQSRVTQSKKLLSSLPFSQF